MDFKGLNLNCGETYPINKKSMENKDINEELQRLQMDTIHEFIELSQFTEENKRMIEKDVDIKLKMRNLAMQTANQMKRHSIDINLSADGELNLGGLFSVNQKEGDNE